MKPAIGITTLLLLLIVFMVSATVGQPTTAYQFTHRYHQPALEHLNTRIVPNVTIRGVAVGQMTREEARATLQQHHADFLQTPLSFELEGYTALPTAEQLGIRLEIDEAVEQAYAFGHRKNPLISLWERQYIGQRGQELPLRLTIDQQMMQAYLQELSFELERSPLDASLRINAGQVVSSPSQTGRQVLIDETIASLPADLQHLQPLSITLQTRPLHPALDTTGIAEAEQYLRPLLQDPLTLTAAGYTWTWTPAEIGTMVNLERVPGVVPGQDRITATLDRERIKERLQQMAAEFDIAPIEPLVRFVSSETVTTTPQLRIMQAGHDGRRLEVEQALDPVVNALLQGQPALDLPTSVVPPGARPDTLDSLGIVERIAQGKSSFANSESYRIANIQAGARRMDGVLIPPGQEFSFNRTVGAVDAAHGFTQGYAIVNGRTQLEWGGGICQISTTVFRAAFWAGVPITERHEHTYRINWYETFEPVGMDATIFTPYGPDLRFVNDTEHWMLMEAYADTVNQIMYVNLYGTSSGREVVQLTPAVTGNALGGVDVNLGRIVRQHGQVLYQDNFFSRFKPWPNF